MVLKKSPKYWYEKFNETMIDYGFKRSENDYCLYTKNDLYVLLYVDDLLLIGREKMEIDELKTFLTTQFRMKDLGDQDLTYLGISIKKCDDYILINQTKFLKNVLGRFGMKDCKGIDTPMETNFKLDDKNIDLIYEARCRSLIGSLLYVTVNSRPDLAFSVNYLSRFQSTANETLWKALKRVLRYVKQTINYTLIFEKNCDIPLIGFADADWGRDVDRKSTTGYLFKIYGNTVIWKSKKQSVVALSTTEAELIALCHACVESCWIVKILKDLNIEVENFKIFEDNQSTIKSINTYDQRNLKHLEIKYNFVKQKVEEGFVNVEYIKSEKQLADILTKPLSKNRLRILMSELDIINIESDRKSVV